METSTDKRILRLERTVVLLLDYLSDLQPHLAEAQQIAAGIRADLAVRSQSLHSSYLTDEEPQQGSA